MAWRSSLICERLGEGGRVVGLDRSSKMIATATRRNSEHVAAGRAAFRAEAFERADFGDERFDKVLAVHWPPMRKDPYGTQRRAGALLRPGGAVYVFGQWPDWTTDAKARAAVDGWAEAAAQAALRVEEASVRELDGSPMACLIAVSR